MPFRTRLSRYTGIDRRLFLLGGLAGTALAHTPAAASIRSEPSFSSTPFTLGVASGDPLADRAIIWTRLAPAPFAGHGGAGDTPVEVEWAVFEPGDPQNVVRSGLTVAWPDLAHSVHVDVDGLAPGREYGYRFACGGWQSPIGRLKTADPEAAECRFAVTSCNNYEHGYFTAFERIAADRPDFIYHAGDFIYEKAGRSDLVRQHRGGQCLTLTDYRQRYAQYRSDAQMQAMHAAAPLVAAWDDHEVAGNWADLDDKFGTPREVFALRRAAAWQAFYENIPIRLPEAADYNRFSVDRAFVFGGGVGLAVLDTRTYRDDQACNDTDGPLCDEALDPARTLLGPRQEAWLEHWLMNRSTPWSVIAQQIPSFRLDYGAGAAEQVSMDKWDGYPVAQARFHAALARHAPGETLVLGGDAHAHFASRLQTGWDDPATAFGWEITTTSASSGGDGSDTDPRWPVMRAENPHLMYHSKRRGYVRCRVTAETAEADFVTLDQVTRPGGQARTDARLTIQRGGPASLARAG